MIGEPALPSIAGLGLEPIDEVDYVVEPAAGAGSDAASGNRDGKMRLAGAGPCCFGTSPIQAEKLRPDRKVFGSATVATRAVASVGPTPGQSSSRMLNSL